MCAAHLSFLSLTQGNTTKSVTSKDQLVPANVPVILQ
jgi:hypothetical protein